MGTSKYGTNSKGALTKDIIEGLQKELEKLRRTEDNIKYRQNNTKNGGKGEQDETESERKKALNAAISMDVEDQGAHVICAEESRL